MGQINRQKIHKTESKNQLRMYERRGERREGQWRAGYIVYYDAFCVDPAREGCSQTSITDSKRCLG